jgi:hypothetical protein
MLVGLLAAAVAAGERTSVFGKVKSVAKDGSSFELTTKGGAVHVDVAKSTTFLEHKGVPIGQVDGGEPIHVLARVQPGGFDPSTNSRIPPAIMQIQAIVVGKDFKPGALDKDEADQRLEWMSGALQKGSNEYILNGTHMNVGPDRIVIVVSGGDPTDVKAGALALVEGAAQGKAKSIDATRVQVLSPQVPAADYQAAFGL